MNSHWWQVFQDAKASLNDTENGIVVATSNKEILATQNRLEELLLELITERVLASKPPKIEELDYPASDHYKGYYEGWWDCLEQLRTVIDNHEEGNDYKMAKAER